ARRWRASSALRAEEAVAAVLAQLDGPVGADEAILPVDHAGTRREREADRRSEAARQDLDALGAIELQPLFGLRQRHHVGHQAQSLVEHLAGAGALRRIVVEEDHALADGHRAARPGADDAAAGESLDPEEE